MSDFAAKMIKKKTHPVMCIGNFLKYVKLLSLSLEFCTEIHHFKKNKIKLMLVGKYFPN